MKNIPIKNAKKVIICPGCGWTGGINDLGDFGSCPECGYENGDGPPYRLCTLKEMLVFKGDRYCEVEMSAFLGALFKVMEDE